MMSQADSVQPLRLAVWLITLFAPAERAESISGDLLEEFSQLSSQSGVPFARRWFWRQTVRTVAHLAVAEIRATPWRHAVTAITGFFLLKYELRFVIPTVEALLEEFHVYEHLAEVAGDVPTVEIGDKYMYFFWGGVLIGRLLLEMLTGGIVTLTTKGKNLTTAVALGLLLSVWGVVGSLAMLGNTETYKIMPLFTLPTVFAHSIAIVLGGVLVRALGSKATLRPSAP